MTRNTLFFIFLFLVKINLTQLELHRWSDDSYGKYNSDSFQKLEIVNQKIDIRLKSIKISLTISIILE